MIAVAGVSASGKSTVARQLAAVSGFPVLSSDLVRKTAAGLRPTERAPVALYADDVSRATYAALGARAAGRAATGVIADATFRRRADRDAFRDALGPGVRVLWIQLVVPAAELERRARARAADPGRVSDAGIEVVRTQLRTAEPLDEVPGAEHALVRSDRSPDGDPRRDRGRRARAGSVIRRGTCRGCHAGAGRRSSRSCAHGGGW